MILIKNENTNYLSTIYLFDWLLMGTKKTGSFRNVALQKDAENIKGGQSDHQQG